MTNLPKWLMLIALAFGQTSCKNAENVEQIVQMTFHSEPDTVKRSIEQNEGMPSLLPMTRSIQGKETTIVLILQETLNADINGETHDEEIKDHGLYREDNEDDFHMFIIERTQNGKFRVLQGSFSDEQGVYEVTPDFEEKDENKRGKRDDGQIPVKLEKREDATGAGYTDLTEDIIKKAKKRGIDLTKSENTKAQRSLLDDDEDSDPSSRALDGSGSGNGKGDEVVKHTLELAMVVDYSVYLSWRTFTGLSKAIKRIRLHFSFIFHLTSLPFRRLSIENKKFVLSVVYFRIINEAADAVIPDMSPNADDALNDFADYNSVNVTQNDHAALFTTSQFGFTSYTAIGRICTNFGVSIIRDIGGGVVGLLYVQTLGLSLGVNSDGPSNPCDPERRFAMSFLISFPLLQATLRNRYKFSSCSRNQIKNILHNLQCTLPEYTSDRPSVIPIPLAERQGGQVVNPNKQCREFFKSRDSSWCQDVQEEQEGGIQSICAGIFCELPDSNSRNCQFVAIPLDFTSCSLDDDTRVCRSGRCQQDCRLLLLRCRELKREEKGECFRELKRCRSRSRYADFFPRKHPKEG